MGTLDLLLILHVIIGLIGIMASYAVLMALLKRTPKLRFLIYSSFVAFISYITSWIIGGYYYISHYGSAVKPIIKSGGYSWAHSFFMESKEHIFLFLPFLSFVIFGALLLFGERFIDNPRLKKLLALISVAVVVIGIFIALSGIIISGTAK